jgi:hypothetical protein
VRAAVDSKNPTAKKAVRLPMSSECLYLSLENKKISEMQAKLIVKG